MRGGCRGTGPRPGRNGERDFHGDECSTDTHALKTDTATSPPRLLIAVVRYIRRSSATHSFCMATNLENRVCPSSLRLS
jgi:hypothetical protein